MSSALERLADLVRKAESRTRAQKLGTETRQAAERLKLAEDRMIVADQRLTEIRPTRQRDLAKAEADELLLKELIKKLAHTLSGLAVEQQKSAEEDIATAQAEITELRKVAQAELDAALLEVDQARQELQSAREQYQSLRRELDHLLPDRAGEFAGDDRLFRETEVFLPIGQIQALAREIDDGERHYSMLDPREQYAQLKIWIGRFRRLQAWAESEHHTLTDEQVSQLREIFPRLVGISKQYMPGYIEAFSRTFETDWDAYVAEAAEQLRQATDVVRRDRESDHRRREPMHREPERPQDRLPRPVRDPNHETLDKLRKVISQNNLPNEGAQAFLAALNEAVASLGPSDPRLLLMIRPYAELLASNDFRILRRNLERIDPDEALEKEALIIRDRIRDILPATQGRRALLIGGDMREDRRRSLQITFDFVQFDWVPFDRSRPGILKALEQRILEGDYDLLLLHGESIGDPLTERLEKVGEESDVATLLIESGTAVAQLVEALRSELPRLLDEDDEIAPATNGTNGQAHDDDRLDD